MKFAFEYITGHALLFTAAIVAGAVCVISLVCAVISGELRDLFTTPQEKDKD